MCRLHVRHRLFYVVGPVSYRVLVFLVRTFMSQSVLADKEYLRVPNNFLQFILRNNLERFIVFWFQLSQGAIFLFTPLPPPQKKIWNLNRYA